jgi:hypothetical protein
MTWFDIGWRAAVTFFAFVTAVSLIWPLIQAARRLNEFFDGEKPGRIREWLSFSATMAIILFCEMTMLASLTGGVLFMWIWRS